MNNNKEEIVDIYQENNPEWEYLFAGVDIKSDDLRGLISDVFSRILPHIDEDETSFGFLIERPTIWSGPIEVTVDGDINIDFLKLKQRYGNREVQMSILAHAFAHCYLEHYGGYPRGNEYETQANALMEKWGFIVWNFLDDFGPKCFVELGAKLPDAFNEGFRIH